MNFVTDLTKVGDSLRAADQSYQNAMGKLSTGSGNLSWAGREAQRNSAFAPTKQLSPKLLERAGIDEAEQAELSLAASGEDAASSVN